MTLWQLAIPLVVGVVLAVLWWAGKAMLEGAREGLREAGDELAQERAAREAREAQEAGVRRQQVEAAAQALTPDQRFALNLRAPFTQLWTQIFEDPATGRPLDAFYRKGSGRKAQPPEGRGADAEC